MKGFIHLIEVAVAAVLVTIVIGTFFSVQDVKLNWEHPDLLALGNSMGFSTEAAGNLSVLLDRFQRSSELNKTKPDNVDYSLYIEGAAKEVITIGCPQNCVQARDYLSTRTSGSSYLNGRWITFNVTDMSMNDNLENYDALILIGFTQYSTYEQNLTNFLNQGKTILAINDYSGTDSAFNNIFGLSSGSAATTSLNFTKYDPADDKTAKYFLGMGYDIDLDVGTWNTWGDVRSVTANSTHVTIQKITEAQDIEVREGETFILKNGGNDFEFKLKEKFTHIVIVQPMEAGFVFENFAEGNVVTTTAKRIISDPSTGGPAMTSNGAAVWMSGFGGGDEYKLLAKAAIASKVNKWQTRGYITSKDRASASYYSTLCCDMPEPTEFNFILWYVY